MICQNCRRRIFGFWKHGLTHVCSLSCLRELIVTKKVSRLLPGRAYPELDILPPRKEVKDEHSL